MVKKNDLIAEMKTLSEKLSERSRIIASGVIATWWAALVGAKPDAVITAKVVLLPAIIAALSILFDFLQYGVGLWANKLALDEVEANEAGRDGLSRTCRSP